MTFFGLAGRIIRTAAVLPLVAVGEARARRRGRPPRELPQETAGIAGGLAALLGVAAIVTGGVLFVLILVAAFAVLAVAFLALVGEWRAGRGFLRGEYVDDEPPLSLGVNDAAIAPPRTPSHLPVRRRVLVGAAMTAGDNR